MRTSPKLTNWTTIFASKGQKSCFLSVFWLFVCALGIPFPSTSARHRGSNLRRIMCEALHGPDDLLSRERDDLAVNLIARRQKFLLGCSSSEVHEHIRRYTPQMFLRDSETHVSLLQRVEVGFPLRPAARLRRARTIKASGYIIRKWKWVGHETMALFLPAELQVETHVLMFTALRLWRAARRAAELLISSAVGDLKLGLCSAAPDLTYRLTKPPEPFVYSLTFKICEFTLILMLVIWTDHYETPDSWNCSPHNLSQEGKWILCRIMTS